MSTPQDKGAPVVFSFAEAVDLRRWICELAEAAYYSWDATEPTDWEEKKPYLRRGYDQIFAKLPQDPDDPDPGKRQ